MEIRTQSTGEQDAMSGFEEARTGRERAGLVRGGDVRRRTDETSGTGKGKGNGGQGEHRGTGGSGAKGNQQSVKKKKGDEEQEADEENERVQVAPNMGAGGDTPTRPRRIQWKKKERNK